MCSVFTTKTNSYALIAMNRDLHVYSVPGTTYGPVRPPSWNSTFLLVAGVATAKVPLLLVSWFSNSELDHKHHDLFRLPRDSLDQQLSRSKFNPP